MYKDFNEFNGKAVEDIPFVMLRGWAWQCITNTILRRPDWAELSHLSPKALQKIILDCATTADCKFTRAFINIYPDVVPWLAGCFRILLKCLIRDWKMKQFLLVEPQLPTILLPDGGEIRCGEPDIVGDSEAYDGMINVELKTGIKPQGKDNGKLARYNSGTSIYMQDNGFQRPFRGTLWVSFASSKQDAFNKQYLPSPKPEMSLQYVPYNATSISHSLQKKFGVDVETMQVLPRHYNGIKQPVAA